MSSTFPKVMYVSRSVPPTLTGASTVALNLAQQFTADEMIVVGAKSRGQAEWPPDGPALRYASWSPPEDWPGGRWLRWAQLPIVLVRLFYICLAERCQVIVVVFPDEIYVMAAYFVSVLLNKPLFPYFHNTYLENRPENTIWLRVARWLQPRVFRRARHVFVMSEGMQQLYQERYPGLDSSPLLHSFSEPLPEPAATPEPGSPLILAMSGNVTASCDDAIARLGRVVQAMPDVRLRIYSGNAVQYERLGLVGESFTIRRVSREELLSGMRSADIIVLPHGLTGNTAEEEIQTIFPTKTIECLIAGRPILAHTPEGCFLTDFLRRHECALIVSTPDEAALQAAIMQLRTDQALRDRLVVNALRAAAQFHAPAVASHLRTVLRANL